MYTAFLSVAMACGTPGLMAALALGASLRGCVLCDLSMPAVIYRCPLLCVWRLHLQRLPGLMAALAWVRILAFSFACCPLLRWTVAAVAVVCASLRHP